MMLLCKLCGYQFLSQSTGAKGKTWLIDQLMHHLSHQHRENTAELAAMIAAVSGYLTLRLYATVPEEETDLRAALADTERELFGLILGRMRLRKLMGNSEQGGQGGKN